MRASGVVWLFLASSLWLTGGAVAESIDEEAYAIASQLQCPICQGESVAASPSQLATQMRQVIRDQLGQGQSREAILQYFVDRYGEQILMAPPRNGFTAIAWIGPYVGLAAAIGFLVWTVRRRRPDADGTHSQPAAGGYLEQVDQTLDQLRDNPLR